jgi:hypothetical protein
MEKMYIYFGEIQRLQKVKYIQVENCKDISSDCFVVNVKNVLNGEVTLCFSDEELNTLAYNLYKIHFVSWPKMQMCKHSECLVP